VLALVRGPNDPAPAFAHGEWRGRIARTAAGSGGFGYDPWFIPAGLQLTAAQLTAEDKNRRSHRGQALRALAAQLAAGQMTWL
jgi:XTP/dITP diphosphohydrolase